MARAKELDFKVKTSRKVPPEEIDLSEEEDVPLAEAATFTSHKSVLLDDKHGLLSHLSLDDRIKILVNERSLVREWGSDTAANAVVAAKVVFAYANKDVSSLPPTKTQQYLF